MSNSELIKNLEDKVKCLQKEIKDLKDKDANDISTLDEGVYLARTGLDYRVVCIGNNYIRYEISIGSSLSRYHDSNIVIQAYSSSVMKENGYKIIRRMTDSDMQRLFEGVV